MSPNRHSRSTLSINHPFWIHPQMGHNFIPPCFCVGCSPNLVDQFSPSPCLLSAVLLKSYSFPRPRSEAIFRKPLLIQTPSTAPLHSSLSNPQRPLLFGANSIYTKDKISEGWCVQCTMYYMYVCHIMETSKSVSFLISNREIIIIPTSWRWCKQQKRWKSILILELG